MADWLFRFDNTVFANDAGVFGSYNYTIPATDMPIYPLNPRDSKASDRMSTDDGDVFTLRRFIRSSVTMHFDSVSEACVATMRHIFQEDIDFLFYEDTNAARTYHWFHPHKAAGAGQGTATCTIVNATFAPNINPGLDEFWTFDLTISEVTGTKDNA